MTADAHHCLLLVEDDDLVRDTISMLLQDEGFDVVEAVSATDAIGRIRDGLDVQVLVTDVDLGGGPSGTDLADTLHGLRPDLRIIFITGRAGGLAERARDMREAVLPKPFEIEALSRLIQRMSPED